PFPNAACLVQHKLGLPRAAAFDLGAACSGYIYALVTGSALIQVGRAETVLVVGADALSKLLDWTDRSTCVLFGDGAGASVLRRVEDGYGLLGASMGCDGPGGDLLKACPLPANGDHRSVIQMQWREVFKFAVRIQAQACEEALAEARLAADDIDWLVPHQANTRIIQAAAGYGNTSAASIPIALAETHQAGKFKRGDHILMVGFGAGLTWGAAVVRWY
ncbi:MAG: beta-ketoacyl-ACP synthase 3, partial [Armatimonadetes bacterium]|nr:beta-ketoacyl-ACP synthase 3 [Armatimonadota bacterium]